MSVGSGIAGDDDERTESANTPPPTDSPCACPVDDVEVQSSLHAPKKAHLDGAASIPVPPAGDKSAAADAPLPQRPPRTWGRTKW